MADTVAEETQTEKPQKEIPEEESQDETPNIVLVAQRHPQDQNFARVVLSQLGGFRVAEAKSAHATHA